MWNLTNKKVTQLLRFYFLVPNKCSATFDFIELVNSITPIAVTVSEDYPASKMQKKCVGDGADECKIIQKNALRMSILLSWLNRLLQLQGLLLMIL
jgi:hypothetical protein